MSERKFASHADLEEKKVSFEKLSANAWAYTAEGDPNTGVIIGEDAVMIIDATATPVMAIIFAPCLLTAGIISSSSSDSPL